MADESWAAATFAGAAEEQARKVARLTPTERVALLEELLELAAASGALAKSRELKQKDVDTMWAS